MHPLLLLSKTCQVFVLAKPFGEKKTTGERKKVKTNANVATQLRIQVVRHAVGSSPDWVFIDGIVE